MADVEVEILVGKDLTQSTVKLSSLIGKKGMVLYFYPKDSTLGCTTEACNFRDSNDKIRSLGYSVVGVSPDSISSHQRFAEKQQLNFALISDTNKTLCQQFQVWQQKQLYGRQFMGVVRSTFLIDTKLKVLNVISPVKVKGHTKEILDLIHK
ncbi:MAG: peroxiredoxin [Leptonema sp. (in: Bacteria)]|nr:peroxiredoxin [Leptonema sp. (in: bacteria)]